MDWFSPVTRSNPASVRARAETLRQKQAKRSTETPWKFEVGQRVKKLCRTSHSNTEKEWCDAVVISLKNTESAPVYTLLFQYDAHQERMTHAQLDTLPHEQPPVPYQRPQHVVRFTVDESLRRSRSKDQELRIREYWEQKLAFDAEEEYCDGT